ncbi:MAG TPA: hypothetical protein PK068_11330 [Nitrosomonas sp.]|nr:hypothetical protein [Nitrosomonas sp.]
MKIFWIVSALLILNACASTSRSIQDNPTLPIESPNNEIALDNINRSISTLQLLLKLSKIIQPWP